MSRYDGMTEDQIAREREYRRRAQAKYAASPAGKAAAARYWQSDKGRATMERSRKANGPKHRERDRAAYRARVQERPDQARAQQRVNYAVSMGWLTKPEACEQCGRTVALHGHHHHGYDEAVELDVLWLCPRCHKAAHRG